MSGCYALCPHCGIDLDRDEPITAGDLVLDPRGDITLAGWLLQLTPSERIILTSLVKARGHAVSGAALLERLGSDSGSNAVHVHMARIRQKLGDAAPGRAFITTMRSLGWRWVGG